MKNLNKKTSTVLFLLLLSFLSIQNSNAQIFWDSAVASNVQTCLQPEKVIAKYTTLVNQNANSSLKISMPQGFVYSGSLIVTKNNAATGNTISLSSSNRVLTVTFTSTLALGDVIRVEFKQFASCAAGISSYTTRDTFMFNGSGGASTQNGNLFNGASPALSITSISNTPGLATVGAPVTRKFTITNGGNGSSSHFFASDNFGAGNLTINTSSFKINPSGINYSIPLSKISLTADSVLVSLDPIQIQQIGDGDTLFENGESFVLQYEVTPLNCGVGNVVLSQYKTSWLCPSNSRCNYYTVSDGLAISIPGAPNVVYFQSAIRKKDCWNNSLWIDTGSIKNTGTGPAKNVVVRVGINGYPVIFRSDMTGYFDTTKFFVKLGKNGAWIKVAYSIYLTGNNGTAYLGCDMTGKPMAVEFTWPILNANDTLYFTAPVNYCNFNYSCDASQSYLHQPGVPGTLMEIAGYKNGCDNISFSGFKTSILGYQYPALQLQNQAPQAIDKNTRADFLQLVQNMPYSLTYSSRALTEIKINIPPVLQFDTAAGPLVYITQGTNTYLPSAHPSGNVWRFKSGLIPGYNAELHIKLKGYCDPTFCSGIVNWGYVWSVNPDTTGCTNFNQFGCVSYPISWNSSCRVCCDSGLVNMIYTTNRVSLGKPDNNNDLAPDLTGVIDTTKIRTNFVLYGDTVEYFQKSYVLQGVNPFASLVGEFHVPNNTAWWDVLSNSVTIKRAGGGTSTATATINWSGDYLRLNYSSLAPFFNNDTVFFRVRLRLKANTQTTLVTQNAAYVSHINNLNQGSATRFSCGPIIDGLSLWYHVQFLDRVQELTATGCNQIIEGNYYYVAEGDYGYGGINRFPFEYRPNAYPTTCKHKYPSGWEIDSVALVFNGGSNFPAAYNNLNIPFTYVNDTLKYNLAPYFTPNGGLLIPTDEGGTVGVYHYLKPTCKALTNISYIVPAQNNNSAYQILNQYYPVNSTSYNTQTTVRNVQPQFLVNSATPVATAYTKNVTWPLTYSNVTSIGSVNNWLYMTNTSGKVVIDSIKNGATLISKDINGFYRIGAINASTTKNLTVYATSTTCALDSVTVQWGYGCSGYPTVIGNSCLNPPLKLFVQPSPAAIQTSITSLAATPVNPANPSGSLYTSSKVFMCSSFPLEFNILSTEPGTIYSVKEKVFLPISGLNVGLDYISDSGYIEFPVGTTPRKFSAAANSALLSQVASGVLTFDLSQIDPVNFNPNSGLYGTGTAPNNDYRRAILRFKFRTNCNLISGAQWQAIQEAISPCGTAAGGNNGVTSGFPLNVNGVTPVPYVATISVVPSLKGCSGDTATFKVIKIGSSAVGVGDSIRLYIPNELTNSAVACYGSACPSAFPAFYTNPAIGGKELTIRIPSTMGNLDSLVFKTKINTPQPNGCSASVKVGADITRQLTIFCPTTGTNCPNAKQSLGSSVEFISMNKPNLSLTSFTGRHMLWTTYEAAGTIANSLTGEGVTSGTPTQIKFFWDMNLNSLYDAGIDLLAHTKTITRAIAPGAVINWTDTFTDGAGIFPPSATLPMIAMIDAKVAPNCNCSSQALSPSLVSLPVHYLNYSVKSFGCLNRIEWTTTEEENINKYQIQVFIDNSWKSIGFVDAKGNSAGTNRYSFAHSVKTGKYIYRIVEMLNNGNYKPQAAIEVNSNCNSITNRVLLLPNPAQNQVSVAINDDSQCGNYKVKIVNLEGKLVKTLENVNLNTTIELNQMAKGLYLVTVECDAFSETVKLVLE